ncbi:MAG TPA: shikimate dehydrogenase [Caulobacterales bacterium]|nr:shikimate dehydrogenase [Caulobacterales bacterium]
MTPITAKTQLLAIFGDPVGRSLSPVMHNGWIEDHGLDAVYVALPLRGGDPVAAFHALKHVGFRGANVTTPHKEAAAAAADSGAFRVANVLRWEADGALSAFNTDGDGFLDALAEAVPGWGARVSEVLILGAGGAAKGIAQALLPGPAQDIDLTIANRTAERAEALAKTLTRAHVGDWNDLGSLFANADLIVQTTTLGMDGTASPHWPVARCKSGAIVVDIVYRPLETPLLKAARAQGLTAVDGLGMLIHQGARAFKLWFDIEPDTKIARQRLLAALGEHE